ncbi:MAG: ferrous iron transport protein B [Intestinibacillus sp.]
MPITIALAGNPNCGKTTMFNDLTGSSQYVGNWPGVTVEKKSGKLRGHKDVNVMDLPGIYSLSPYTLEEVVSRNYLLDEKPDVILNLIDGSNIERNLYLTTQLLEVGAPVVIALNMMDIVRKRGDKVDIRKLSAQLGCPIIETAAIKGEGSMEAAEAAIRQADKGASPALHRFSEPVEKALAEISDMIEAKTDKTHRRWFAIKLFERDEKVMERLGFNTDVRARLEEIIVGCEDALDDDAESIITNERYAFIAGVVRDSVTKKAARGSLTTSDKIDRVVTNRWLALPIFALIMFVVYYVSVTSLGTVVTDFTNDILFGEWIQPAVGAALEAIGTAPWLVSMVVDGIIGGLAAPIGFAPQMAILFVFLSFLEDCGYMARVAFIMDRIFRRFGLSGKSFIPLLISSGCGVPGIMATRTIEDEKDRRLTIMTTTAIPCGAKLPVIALIAGAILGGAWWMAPTMYFMGIATVIVSAIILKKTKPFAGETSPFVMELPQYHLPAARNVLLHVWERVWSFLKKAGTVLFICCAVMWFLGTFGFGGGQFGMIDELDGARSLLEIIGGAIAPIFAPLGFGNWQAVAASLSGFVAKEGIVSTMAVIVGLADATEGDASLWTAVMTMFPSALAAFSFLMFNLLDSPCLAAISTIAKEMHSKKWTTLAILWQNVFAYAATLIVYQIGSLVTGGAFTVWSGVAIVLVLLLLYLLFRPNPYKKGGNPQARVGGAKVGVGA